MRFFGIDIPSYRLQKSEKQHFGFVVSGARSIPSSIHSICVKHYMRLNILHHIVLEIGLFEPNAS